MAVRRSWQRIEFLSTPSGWRATNGPFSYGATLEFLSTPSGWRATGLIVPKRPVKLNFYPRPPGGGRRQ